MQLSIISFTKTGMLLSKRIQKELDKEFAVKLYTKCKALLKDIETYEISFVEISVREWAGIQMKRKEAILFIGACGIAVRSIAPFLTDKLQDAPVLVMDETGKYVIPILAGHIGGANELAEMLATKTGAIAVITTATDLHKKFAVDLFAKKNGLFMEEKAGIAKVSAKVLAKEEITISIENGHSDGLSERTGIQIVPYPPSGYVDIIITSSQEMFDTAIVLHPKEYVLGFGCKKGKQAEEIGQFIEAKLRETDIRMAQIYALASISQKKEEKGILEWCRKENVPFLTYTAKELQKTEGNFTKSAFVKKQVGVDNVCERSALKACGASGKLIVQKYAQNGMTIAIAKRDWNLVWG